MAVYKWQRRKTRHFGEVSVPLAEINLQSRDGGFCTFAFQIDSGAVVSLLRRSVADLLGLDLTAGRKVDLAGVGGASTVAYIHELQTRFDDSLTLGVPFAIADSETVPNLLGRLGVFDKLQVDFDASLTESRITCPWLDTGDRRIWEFLLETEAHILKRWSEIGLSESARGVAKEFVDRGDQLFAAAAGLMKLHRLYASPLIIRAAFELSLQFEYLMQDPEPRSRLYRDFFWVSKQKYVRAVAEKPSGPVSRWVAASPMRPEGEKLNRARYEAVKRQFERDKSGGQKGLWDKWYRMRADELARELTKAGEYDWAGEYRLWYKSCSAWMHGDPFGMGNGSLQWSETVPRVLFLSCARYQARMLLVTARQIVLTSEQYSGLTELAKSMS